MIFSQKDRPPDIQNISWLSEAAIAATAIHIYSYRPGTDWLQNITANDGAADTFRQHYARDKAGRLLSATRHTLAGSAPAALTHYAYQHDELDRPYRATLLDGSTWTWGRNGRGEITSAVRELPGEIPVPALGADYDYDDIGNRKTATSPILGNFTYTPNAVNQYTAIQTNDTRTVLGTAPVASTVTVNSQSTTRLGNIFSAPLTGNNATVTRTPPDTGTIFHKAITGTNLNAPVLLEANVSDGTTTKTRHAWLPASATSLQYDDDGNLTHDGQWSYLWDAENRLVEMETTQAAVTAGRPYRRLTFAYDWTGRRLARDIHGPNNTLLNATRWLYDGWNPVAEFSDQTTGQTLVRAYLWGMDLNGNMQGAGGVGGLLSAFEISNSQISNRHFPSYDGNGNIVAWTSSGATAPTCLREYDSFGNILIEHGTPPCQFGFSTKIEDPETGLFYYGYRYLSPPLGRWLSRDPIEEQGGLNLYGFLGNDGVKRWDFLGLCEFSSFGGFVKWLTNSESSQVFNTHMPSVEIDWDCFDRDGTAKRHLLSVWRARNIKQIKNSCGAPEIRQHYEMPYRGVDVLGEPYQSHIYWINAYQGEAIGNAFDGVNNLSIWKWRDRAGFCHCKALAGLRMRAHDKSDFNEGETFFFIIPDGIFIWLRDNTILGHDYRISAKAEEFVEYDLLWSDDRQQWEALPFQSEKNLPPFPEDRRNRDR